MPKANNQMNNSIPSPWTEEMNTIKVVLFMETKPMTDNFMQMMFTVDQMKKILDFISGEVLGRTNNDFVVTCNDDHEYTFNNIKTHYTQEELDDTEEDDA